MIARAVTTSSEIVQQRGAVSAFARDANGEFESVLFESAEVADARHLAWATNVAWLPVHSHLVSLRHASGLLGVL